MKLILKTVLCLGFLCAVAPAQDSPFYPPDPYEDDQYPPNPGDPTGGTGTCPNPQDYAPGCISEFPIIICNRDGYPCSIDIDIKRSVENR